MKKSTIVLIIAVIILYTVYISLQIAGNMGALKSPAYLFIRISFYGCMTVLCSVIAFLIKDGLDKDDRILLKYAFVFLIAGTVFFICNTLFKEFLLKDPVCADLVFALGNIYFYGMHFSLIFRHMGKTRERFFKKTSYSKVLSTVLAVCFGLTVLLSFLYFVLKPLVSLTQGISVLFITSCIVYAIIIAIGLVYACRTLFSGVYKKANALLIAIGFISFVFCELGMVYSIVFPQYINLSRIITAIYYTPGFLFLALSGYKSGET